MSIVTGCGVGADRMDESGSDDGDAEKSVVHGTARCLDASPGFHPADDRSWAAVRNGNDDSWLVDPEGNSQRVDLDAVANPYSLGVGGDGRLWSINDQGGVAWEDKKDTAEGPYMDKYIYVDNSSGWTLTSPAS
jgi:hypothetical protein